jgi:hypothetical protein
MEHDDPTEWPPDGHIGDGWLGDSDDVPGLELGPDPQDPSDYPTPDDDPSGEDGSEPDLDGAGRDGGYPPDGDESDWIDGPVLADETGEDQPTVDLHDPVPGTDPDVNPLADDESWNAALFPQALTFDQPPEPVDGMPWSDPSLLGDGDVASLPDPTAGLEGPPVADLYTYHAAEPVPGDADPWASLADSDDPATSSLARFWASGVQRNDRP